MPPPAPASRVRPAAAQGAGGGAYRLVRRPAEPPATLQPDEAQRAVLEHEGGPLLVLAGPGTGKTTTLVEAVARRVEAGADPQSVLVLTFSRKAAQELRDRTTARLGTATAGPSAWTFHAFCYALLREHRVPGLGHDGLGGDALRLLSAPEQDVALRELLRHSDRRWPDPLRPALGTRGLAEEVRALLARARELGLDPGDLAALAAREGRADWQQLAGFWEEYLDVLDARGVLDHGELVARAVRLAERADVAAALRQRFRAVLVDEYQDTDPAQERLLQVLAGGGRDLVVVGDPDQAVYAFRGAEVSGLLEFPHRFPRADGAPAPVVALQTCRRSGAALLEATRRVAERIPAPGLPADRLRAHRELRPAPGAEPGRVEVLVHPTAGAEAEAVADLLRREHLEHGTPWARMAVLVRSGARSLPLLRRVLSAAGVPVEVAGDELPLAQEPAVAPLLVGLRAADDPASLTEDGARALLLSPLGGADPAALRRLGRALRAQERELHPDRLPPASAVLLREALVEPGRLLLLDERAARPAVRLAALLDRARRVLADGEGPEGALWELWAGSPWPHRLEAAALAGGAVGRAADRDLDAIVALFATIGRATERLARLPGVTALLDELEAQQIPGDVLAEKGVRGDAVRLLTAHRSKGLEWDVVVVCQVQDGGWPDLRRRGSLLEPDRLAPPGEPGLREPLDRARLLADERRLLYVALTRARRRVVVTAVDSGEEDGERPSRFLGDLGVEVVRAGERAPRPLSLPALVAALRREAVDPARSAVARRAAAARLAALAAASDDAGRPLVPAAHPSRWWGLAEPTPGTVPVHPADQPVRLSGTSLAALRECPLRWFFEHEAHAQPRPSAAMGFGSVLHALAHEVARGETPPDLDALTERLDRVWHHLAFDAPWQSAQQREEARTALGRFLAWHAAARGRELVDSEVRFATEVPLEGGIVLLRGSFDRVERDADGRVHVVDLKTGKTKPSRTEVAEHAQLATYQLALRHGALGTPVDVGGAELVMLRCDGPDGAHVPRQEPLPEGRTWVEEALEAAVADVVAERFPPTPGDRCDRCAFRRACPAQPEGRQVVE